MLFILKFAMTYKIACKLIQACKCDRQTEIGLYLNYFCHVSCSYFNNGEVRVETEYSFGDELGTTYNSFHVICLWSG